jgi:serine/threonine protein phosphatase PrpC
MADSLTIKWYATTLHKSGNQPHENEDHFAPHIKNGVHSISGSFICALADGATSTSFASIWSSILVDRFSLMTSPDDFGRYYKESIRDWKSNLASMDLPWHAEEKTKQGAYSSLLWFSVSTRQDAGLQGEGTWLCIAVGDSNLIQIRNNSILRSFPYTKSSEFHNHPFLLASNSSSGFRLTKDSMTSGHWSIGDDFFLVSDALGAFLLKEIENRSFNSDIFKVKLYTNPHKVFSSWVDHLRDQKLIKNDDTSVVWIKVIGGE